jgi:excisionase family DNA binding protein
MTAESPFVNIEDVAKHFVVSVATVRKWIKSGVIPKPTYLKIGNTYRFNLPEVVAALTTAPATPVQLELDFNKDN